MEQNRFQDSSQSSDDGSPQKKKAHMDCGSTQRIQICDYASSDDPLSSPQRVLEKAIYLEGSSQSSVDSSSSKIPFTQPSQVSSVEKEVYPCPYQKYGCSRTYLDPANFKHHVMKNCKFSILNACREETCRGSPNAKFETFNDLMQHVTSAHAVGNLLQNEGVATFQVPRSFFDRNPHEDLKAKILGYLNFEEDGETYAAAFLLIPSWSAWGTEKRDRVSLVAVQYGRNACMDHLMQLRCTIAGANEKFLHPLTGMTNAKSGISVTNAIGNPLHFFIAMQDQDEIISFDKEDFLDHARQGKDGNLEFDLLVKLRHFRSRILRQSGFEPAKPKVNLGSLTLEECVREDLIKSRVDNRICGVQQILIPQIQSPSDLIIESSDNEVMFQTLSAALFSYAIQKNEFQAESNPKKCVAIVLFPNKSILEKAQRAWKDKGSQFGVLVTSLPSDDQVIMDALKIHGCEILLTTPDVLSEVPQSNSLFLKLKYIVLMDADHCSMSAISHCMAKIREQVYHNLVRIAVSPVVTKTLLISLYSNAFPFGANVFSLGIKPDACIEMMNMNTHPAQQIDFKRDIILEIFNKHDHDAQRWIIIAVEDTTHAPGHYGRLIGDLRKAFGSRVCSVQTQEEMDQNPNAFDPFLTNPRGILVTGYFCLNDVKLLKHCCTGVILHSMPLSKPDLRRVAELVVQDGYAKLCIGLRDQYTQHVAAEPDIFN